MQYKTRQQSKPVNVESFIQAQFHVSAIISGENDYAKTVLLPYSVVFWHFDCNEKQRPVYSKNLVVRIRNKSGFVPIASTIGEYLASI